MKLWLDDLRPVPKNEEWVLCKSVNEAIAVMLTGEVLYASLDHDLGIWASEGGDGTALVDWMAEHNIWPKTGIAVHSANPVGAKNMLATIERYAPYPGTRGAIPLSDQGEPK
jgi:hypothetical protein